MFKNDKRIARDDSIARQRWQEFLPLVGVVGWVGEHDVVVTTPQARLFKETSHATGMDVCHRGEAAAMKVAPQDPERPRVRLHERHSMGTAAEGFDADGSGPGIEI